MREVKDAVMELAKQLPDECTWDEVMYRIFVRQKVDAGLDDADAGRVTPHDEVFEEFTNDAPVGPEEVRRFFQETPP